MRPLVYLLLPDLHVILGRSSAKSIIVSMMAAGTSRWGECPHVLYDVGV